MKKVYSSEHPAMTGHVQSLLENTGIECVIKNQYLSGGMGELPVNECWPEVWITDDRDLAQAMQIVNTVIHGNDVPGTCWQCRCGEQIESQFSACWNCGSERPD